MWHSLVFGPGQNIRVRANDRKKELVELTFDHSTLPDFTQRRGSDETFLHYLHETKKNLVISIGAFECERAK